MKLCNYTEDQCRMYKNMCTYFVKDTQLGCQTFPGFLFYGELHLQIFHLLFVLFTLSSLLTVLLYQFTAQMCTQYIS